MRFNHRGMRFRDRFELHDCADLAFDGNARISVGVLVFLSAVIFVVDLFELGVSSALDKI